MHVTVSLPAQLHAHVASIPSPPFQDLVMGPLQFRMYGLAIAAGAIVAVTIARRRWAARGGDPEQITTLAIIGVPAGLVGARIYHVVTDFGDKYSGGRWWPDALYIWQGGLGIPGGVLLGAIAVIIACRVMKVEWRHVADAAAPALPVAQAIGRLGNWFNQELYGSPTTLPWGLEVDDRPGTLFHPTFLYEGLWNLALAAAIVMLGRRYVLRPGRWFAVYVMGYGLGRLWVESLRIDFATEVLGLRVNIWISLLAILGGAIWFFWKGSPVDEAATAELRAGGDPQAEVAAPAAPAVDDRSADDGALEREGAPEHAGFGQDDDTVAAGQVAGRGRPPGSAGASAVAAGEAAAHPVGEPGPGVDGPVAERPVGEHDAGERDLGIDPQEGP
jgi:prolipoprotein diacylglyceryl transferase